jgi:hypothetical protein
MLFATQILKKKIKRIEQQPRSHARDKEISAMVAQEGN